MKTIVLAFFAVGLLLPADSTPTLTDAQKLAVAQIQIQVASLDAQKSQAYARYLEASAALEKANAALTEKVNEVSPKGWALQSNYILMPEKKESASVASPAK